MDKPNYYTVIPAMVRYDKNLKDKSKLLYGEIVALSDKNGECWASNNYFAELYNISTETVSRLINSLIKNGYLESKIIYEQDTKKIDKRVLIPIDKNINTYCQNNQGGIDKKVKGNNTRLIKENIKRKFNIFWDLYPRKVSKGTAEKWFEKNNPSDELLNIMIEKIKLLKTTEQWKSDNGKYIPYPSTWLNAKGWEDEIKVSLKPKTEKRIF